MKRIIRTAATILFAACLISACSTSALDEGAEISTGQILSNISVGDYPAFTSDPKSRTVGTYDEGKSSWTANDEILLKITDAKGTVITTTLVCSSVTNGTPSWTIKTGNISLLEGLAIIEAYYAPSYEWSNNQLALKSGKTAGTDEYLTHRSVQTLASGLTISFGTRTYSRLRVATMAGMKVTLTSAAFTANGGGTAQAGITATADGKGNAYFYGTWTAGATLVTTFAYTGVTISDASKINKTLSSASADNAGYAINGFENGYEPFKALYTKCNELGGGTATSPYLILNATQLKDLATNAGKGKYYKQMCDIDLGKVCSATLGNWNPISFTGTYDGDNKAISGLYINNSSAYYQGLFASVTSNGAIKNIKLKNPAVTGNQYVGGVVGTASSATVSNCSVMGGTITGTAQNIGGVIGMAETTTVSNCSNSSTVNGGSGIYIGGIVGYSMTGSILTGCVNTGGVSGSRYVGGVAGYSSFKLGLNSYIIGCYNSGSIQVGGSYGGGVTGGNYSSCKVVACYTTGNVTGTGNRIGIAIGENNGTATAVYFTGDGNGTGSTSQSGLALVSSPTTASSWTTPISTMNTAIKDWNTSNSSKLCNYQFKAGSPYPTLVAGAPN